MLVYLARRKMLSGIVVVGGEEVSSWAEALPLPLLVLATFTLTEAAAGLSSFVRMILTAGMIGTSLSQNSS